MAEFKKITEIIIKQSWLLFYFVFFFLFIIPVKAYASTYYISVADGNDTNCTGLASTAYTSGLGQPCPWKTISKINSSSFSAGDTISFKMGETWREQLNIPSSGSSGNPITFNSYGSGDKPKIYGSNTPSSWTNEANLYYATQSVDPGYIWFIDTGGVVHNGRKTSSKSNLLADYDWWFDSANSRLYINSATNPLTRYSSVEVTNTTRNRGIIWTGSGNSYITIDGFDVAFITGVGIVLRGDYWTVTNNHVHHIGNEAGGHSYGIELQTATQSRIANNVVHDTYRAGIYIVTSPLTLIKTT